MTIRVNTPPNTPTITLSPATVYGSDSLTVSIANSSDDDGDPVSHLIQWYENGVLTSNTLSTVTCNRFGCWRSVDSSSNSK